MVSSNAQAWNIEPILLSNLAGKRSLAVWQFGQFI